MFLKVRLFQGFAKTLPRSMRSLGDESEREGVKAKGPLMGLGAQKFGFFPTRTGGLSGMLMVR